tara:strand:- start:127 stop:318 length:192 start_codon:yes stop_codon:yes gene_type:complete
MDAIGKQTHEATHRWMLLDWKRFRSSVKDYYLMKDEAYGSGNYSLVEKFREFKLDLILKHNKL